MTTIIPTPFALAATGLYGVIVLLSLAAASAALLRRQPRWSLIAWLLLAALFCGLAVLRLYGIEETVRNSLRMQLVLDGTYDERRSFQRPLAGAVLALIGSGAFVLIYKVLPNIRGRRNVAVMIACASAFTMIGLVLLRLISLSSTDALLYGPAKLNWIVDIGSSFLVAASAGYYAWLVGRTPLPPPHHEFT